MLKDYNIFSLFDILRKNFITAELVWDLQDEELREMGLNIGERKKYSQAKERKIQEEHGKMTILLEYKSIISLMLQYIC